MRYSNYLMIFCFLAFISCKKIIDVEPQSNLYSDIFYKTESDAKIAINACYNGMQRPLLREWQLTEIRSDNSIQGETGSQNSFNRDLSDLDMFFPATTNQGMYLYWLDTYNNIRNANIIINKLGVIYDPAAGAITFGTSEIPMTDSVRKQLAGEAMFIRAYHYFNLVRLFGGVFLIHTPITAKEAKAINRSSVDDMYKFIIADLVTASGYLSKKKYTQIATSDVGRASSWAAKALLAKVNLTRNRKAEAITQLQDIITNSGYSLVTIAGSSANSYANVFSVSNEMNSEIIFAVRYKAGGLGLGSSFGNDFAAGSSGSTIINGSGQGWNHPAWDLDTAIRATGDTRKDMISAFGSGNSQRLYSRKYLSPVVLTNDGESDWPVLRFSDVLLMLAEAQGFSPASIALIDQIRVRAGLPVLPASVNTEYLFEQALSKERRLEFVFENQRWFDLVRFNTTMINVNTVGTNIGVGAVATMQNHFARIYTKHYNNYPAPKLTLAQIQANVDANHLLLPIPQYEIDTNTELVIPQNPGY